MNVRRYRFDYSFKSTVRRLGQATVGSGIRITNGALHRPFYIVGSGRSGTTLLRRILCSNADVHIPPELELYRLIKLYHQHRKLKWRDFVYMAFATIEYRYEGFDYSFRNTVNRLARLPRNDQSLATIIVAIAAHDAEEKGITFTRWGDKTPFNTKTMPEIATLFPDAQFIHLYRDGCDVVQSHIKHELGSWDYESVARWWVESTEAVHRFPDQSRVHTIRYEDLVTAPETHVRDLCSFLDLEFVEAMLEVNDKGMHAIEDVLALSNHENVGGPVSTESIGKGRAAVPREDLEKIAPILDPLLIKLGYEACLH